MSLFGSLFKIAGGFLAGGPAGAIAAGTSLILHRTGANALQGGPTATDSTIINERFGPGGIGGSRLTKIYTNGGRYNGGGPPHMGVTPTLNTMVAGCPAGHRLNKSTYVTRGGGTSHWPQSLQVHEKGTTCVKRRRRNVGNAKALRRAISRVKGFVKLARKAHSLVGGHRGKQKRLAPGQNIEIVRG
jgi:hypothetical protein